MAKAVRLVVGEVRAFGPDQLAAGQAGKSPRQIGSLVIGEQLGERPAQNVRPTTAARSSRRRSMSGNDRAAPPGAPRSLAGSGDRRQSDRRDLVPSRRRASSRRICDELLDEERVALGRGKDPGTQRPGRQFRRERSSSVGGCPISSSEFETDQQDGWDRTSQSGRSLLELRACDGDEQDRTTTKIEDVLEELDQRRLGPLEVVDEKDERALGGQRLEEAPDRPAGSPRPGPGRRRARRSRRPDC